jgi:hypothetical protein
MLTSKPRKKKRGRQPPPYGPMLCPLCASKLKLASFGLYCVNLTCGWKE